MSKEAKTEEKVKGNLGDRVLKNLARDEIEVAVTFVDESDELKGKIKGVGQYSFVVATNAGNILVMKHSVKYVMPVDPKAKLKW